MEIFSELEEQNLSLIQNSQETEEGLEEVKQNRQLVQQKMYVCTIESVQGWMMMDARTHARTHTHIPQC